MEKDRKKETSIPTSAVAAAEGWTSRKTIDDKIIADTGAIVKASETDGLGGAIGTIGAFVMPEEDKKNGGLTGFKPFVPIESETHLPDFPIDALSPDLRDFTHDIAEFTQTSPAMVASAVLGTMATAAQGKFIIEGYEGFQQPLNLYLATVAPPGERKSSVMDLTCRCIFEYEFEQQIRMKPILLERKRQREILESKINVARAKGNYEEIEDFLKELDDLPSDAPPRLVTNDVTAEKLVSLLSENGGVMTIASAEGGIFGTMEGRYSSKAANLDVWLNAYCGDPIKVDRIGRESAQINSPTLTMILSVQPITLKSLVNNELFLGRGLVDRFLFCIPPQRSGKRHFKSDPIRNTVKDAFFSLFNTLMDTPTTSSRKVIYLSDEAFSLLDQYFTVNEEYLSGEGHLFPGWCSKHIATVLRIAGLLHLAIDPIGNTRVSGDTMAAAIDIGLYYRAHARHVYASGAAITPEAKIPVLLSKLRELGGIEVKRSVLVHSLRIKHFEKVADIQPTLDLMIDHGYIRMSKPISTTRGKKPDFTITVRPELM